MNVTFSRVDVCVFCSAVKVIKHRADSGAAVKGPCSNENGQRVREGRGGGRRRQLREGERRERKTDLTAEDEGW